MSPVCTLDNSTRCTHRTSDGRRCQMPFAPNHTALCAQHALQELQLLDMKAVAEELVGPLADFRSAYAINRSLTRLYAIAAEGRISPRNAVALGYIGQLLIQTLKPLREEALEMGFQGRTHAIAQSAANHFSEGLEGAPPNALSATAGKPTSASDQRMEESLAIIKNAGIHLSPDHIRKLRTGIDHDNEFGFDDDEENVEESCDEGSGAGAPDAGLASGVFDSRSIQD